MQVGDGNMNFKLIVSEGELIVLLNKFPVARLSCNCINREYNLFEEYHKPF